MRRIDFLVSNLHVVGKNPLLTERLPLSTSVILDALEAITAMHEALDTIAKIKPGDPIDASAIARDVLRKESE